MTRLTRLTLLALLAAAALDANAQDPTAAPIDPWVPPHLRKAVPTEMAPSRGTALRAEIENRIRAPFEAAAVDGVLTRERAAAAGLGFVARNFDAIDSRRTGAIRFEDYKRFLKERGAALD